jgi:hypothetical protein
MLIQQQKGFSNKKLMKIKRLLSLRFELRILDSKSRVITASLQEKLSYDIDAFT